jgi:hypothetical protein
LEDVDIDDRMTCKDIGWEGMHWIHLAQVRQWLAFIHLIIKIQVQKMK